MPDRIPSVQSCLYHNALPLISSAIPLNGVLICSIAAMRKVNRTIRKGELNMISNENLNRFEWYYLVSFWKVLSSFYSMCSKNWNFCFRKAGKLAIKQYWPG